MRSTIRRPGFTMPHSRGLKQQQPKRAVVRAAEFLEDAGVLIESGLLFGHPLTECAPMLLELRAIMAKGNRDRYSMVTALANQPPPVTEHAVQVLCQRVRAAPCAMVNVVEVGLPLHLKAPTPREQSTLYATIAEVLFPKKNRVYRPDQPQPEIIMQLLLDDYTGGPKLLRALVRIDGLFYATGTITSVVKALVCMVFNTCNPWADWSTTTLREYTTKRHTALQVPLWANAIGGMCGLTRMNHSVMYPVVIDSMRNNNSNLHTVFRSMCTGPADPFVQIINQVHDAIGEMTYASLPWKVAIIPNYYKRCADIVDVQPLPELDYTVDIGDSPLEQDEPVTKRRRAQAASPSPPPRNSRSTKISSKRKKARRARSSSCSSSSSSYYSSSSSDEASPARSPVRSSAQSTARSPEASSPAHSPILAAEPASSTATPEPSPAPLPAPPGPATTAPMVTMPTAIPVPATKVTKLSRPRKKPKIIETSGSSCSASPVLDPKVFVADTTKVTNPTSAVTDDPAAAIQATSPPTVFIIDDGDEELGSTGASKDTIPLIADSTALATTMTKKPNKMKPPKLPKAPKAPKAAPRRPKTTKAQAPLTSTEMDEFNPILQMAWTAAGIVPPAPIRPAQPKTRVRGPAKPRAPRSRKGKAAAAAAAAAPLTVVGPSHNSVEQGDDVEAAINGLLETTMTDDSISELLGWATIAPLSSLIKQSTDAPPVCVD